MKLRKFIEKKFFPVKQENHHVCYKSKPANFVDEIHICEENEVDMANMVETNIGLMPEEDCNEIWALQCGFDSYEDMQEQLRKGNI